MHIKIMLECNFKCSVVFFCLQACISGNMTLYITYSVLILFLSTGDRWSCWTFRLPNTLITNKLTVLRILFSLVNTCCVLNMLYIIHCICGREMTRNVKMLLFYA